MPTSTEASTARLLTPLTLHETLVVRVLWLLWLLASSIYWLSLSAVTLQLVVRLCGSPQPWQPLNFLAIYALQTQEQEMVVNIAAAISCR